MSLSVEAVHPHCCLDDGVKSQEERALKALPSRAAAREGEAELRPLPIGTGTRTSVFVYKPASFTTSPGCTLGNETRNLTVG